MPLKAVCDLTVDCIDGEDERDGCVFDDSEFSGAGVSSPAMIDFDYLEWGLRSFTARPLTPGALCPESHFRCAEKGGNCLPVYLRLSLIHI